jgi:hypothetical protein
MVFCTSGMLVPAVEAVAAISEVRWYLTRHTCDAGSKVSMWTESSTFPRLVQ